jgi:hypothetical protein
MMYVVVVSLGTWKESLLYIDVVHGRKVIDFVAPAAIYQLGNNLSLETGFRPAILI